MKIKSSLIQEFLQDYQIEINQNLQLNPVLNNSFSDKFEFFNIQFYGTSAILVIVKNNFENSIKTLDDSKKILEKYFQKIIIFYFEKLDANFKFRLIQKRINFIAENKQICIFDLLIYFEEHSHKSLTNMNNEKQFKPQTQLFIIYFLLKNKDTNLECKSFKELAPIFNCTPMTMSNIMENLKFLQLIDISGTKEKYFNFNYNKNEVLNVSIRNNFFINPLYAIYYVDNLPPKEFLTIADNSVLSHYLSNFNQFAQVDAYAIDKIIFYDFVKNNLITPNKVQGKYTLYVLKYNPTLISIQFNEYSILDPLSYYFLRKDNIEHQEFYLDYIKKAFYLG